MYAKTYPDYKLYDYSPLLLDKSFFRTSHELHKLQHLFRVTHFSSREYLSSLTDNCSGCPLPIVPRTKHTTNAFGHTIRIVDGVGRNHGVQMVMICRGRKQPPGSPRSHRRLIGAVPRTRSVLPTQMEWTARANVPPRGPHGTPVVYWVETSRVPG